MWLIAETEVAERQILIRQNFEEMWKAYNNPAIILGNLQIILSSPILSGAGASEMDPAMKDQIVEALSLVSQLQERSQREIVSTGG